jgi:hypothetical protein
MIRRGRPYLEFREEPAGPEAEQLEREGYTLIRGMLSGAEVQELRGEIAEATRCRSRTRRCSATPC